MAGRRQVAAPGEPQCPEPGCRRPAGFATATPGTGPCRRHGGERPAESSPYPPIVATEPLIRVSARAPEPIPPPPWSAEPNGAPYDALLTALTAARAAGQPFSQAWAASLVATLDGLPQAEFEEWASLLLATVRGWMDAYELRPSRLAELLSGDVRALS